MNTMNTMTTTTNTRAGFRTRISDFTAPDLDILHRRLEDRRNRTRCHTVTLADLNVMADVTSEPHTLVVNGAIPQSEPTHWAFSQLCSQLQIPAAYIRTLPPHLAVQNIQHAFDGVCDRKVGALFTNRSVGSPMMRALTGPSYGRIYDSEVVRSVREVVEQTKVFTPIAKRGLTSSDRDVYMFMADMTRRIDVGTRAQLHRGFIVTNSEVGSKAFTLTTFLFNSVCSNGLIMGMQGVDKIMIRHTSGGPDKFASIEVGRVLTEFAEASESLTAEPIRRAMEYRLPEVDPATPYAKTLVRMALSAGAKFSMEEMKTAIELARTEEGQCATLWDLMQGITASARDLVHSDTAADLQSKAGRLISLAA